MNELGARVRLVKGAYKEPRDVAYQIEGGGRRGVRAHHARSCSRTARIPAIATHDPAMIDATRAFAAERGIDPAKYEFQMLYGIRRDLQAVACHARVIASASTFHSAVNGSPTSCAGWANVRPMSDSSFAAILGER